MTTYWILAVNPHQAVLSTMEDDAVPKELFRIRHRIPNAAGRDPKNKLERLFVEELSNLLEHGMREHLFEWLVVIAPEPVATRLVYQLDAQVFGRLACMVHRDACRMSAHELKYLLERRLRSAFEARNASSAPGTEDLTYTI